MKVVIDSYGLLGAIGCHPEAFAGIDALVKKQATALLTAQLKHKSLNLGTFRVIVSAIGAEPFELFLDTAEDKLLKSIAKKVDQYAPVTRSDDEDALRAHLIDLAGRRVEPTAKPVRSAATSRRAATSSRTSDTSEPSEPHAIATKPPGR